MESAITDVLERTMKEDGVEGVLVADSNGLCLGSKGNFEHGDAGYIVSLATRAGQLQSVGEFTVCIETESANLLIHNGEAKDGESITVAINKIPM